MGAEGQDGKGTFDEVNNGKLSLKDKFWVALAIVFLVLLFVAVLIFGIF